MNTCFDCIHFKVCGRCLDFEKFGDLEEINYCTVRGNCEYFTPNSQIDTSQGIANEIATALNQAITFEKFRKEYDDLVYRVYYNSDNELVYKNTKESEDVMECIYKFRYKIFLETETDIVEFNRLATALKEDIYVMSDDGMKVNAKSILGLLYARTFRNLYMVTDTDVFTQFRKFIS